MSAFHLKYRPEKLSDFKGEDNESVVISLQQQIQKKWDSIPRAFLFVGASGCGKTTLARIVAKELGCSKRDFYEYNGANTRGIDTIRDISSSCHNAPFEGKLRCYLIDECHSLTKDAFNALLKILEDTPSHVFFFLCTPYPEALLKEIKNRCSIYTVANWDTAETYQYLKYIVGLEKGLCSAKTIKKIAEKADGSPRRALTILDQVINMDNDKQAQSLIINYSDEDTNILDLCRLMIEKRTDSKWDKIRQLIKGFNGEAESARFQILGYLDAVLLNQASQNGFACRVNLMRSHFEQSWMYSKKSGMITACFNACFEE